MYRGTCISLIDYRKAFDNVRHEELFKIAKVGRW